MNVRRIIAKTTREAMRQLRDALGPDAVILANRQTGDGVEIMALPPEDVASLAVHVDEPRPRARRQPEAMAEPAPAFAAAPARAPAAEKEGGMLAQNVLREIRKMQSRLEAQLSDLSLRDLIGRDPARSHVMRELLGAGFSSALARQIVEKMPAAEAEQALAWAKASLIRNLPVMESEADMLEAGGVCALMGPTGAGKTTTTAKLAARFVVRHGAEKLALLTTDGYRIGGHEQLRIYGRILGVSVHAVRDASDLRLALAELRNKHTVLIDTVGMSQRDQAVGEQVEMLCQAGRPIKRLLLLNATSHGETLNEVVRAYRAKGLDGCILSKIDEAATLGPALDCAIRHQLSVHYLAAGQRVPEDLHLANRQYLIHRAFKLKQENSPFRLQEDELPFAFAGGMGRLAAESAVALG